MRGVWGVFHWCGEGGGQWRVGWGYESDFPVLAAWWVWGFVVWDEVVSGFSVLAL